METPWKKAIRQRYEKQELRTAKKPGARAQINSGRVWHSLRDVSVKTVLGRLLIDNKTTEARSYTISLDGKDGWNALKRDANRTPPGCSPGFQIDIREISLIVLEEQWFDDLLDYTRVLEERLAE